MSDDERKDVVIGAPPADAGGDPVGDDEPPAPEPEDEDE